jgi:hypothetical protein
MKGQRPDYQVKFPVGDVWHKLGVGWKNNGGTINVVLDVGVAMTLQPGSKLVLVPEREEAGAA